MECGKNTCGMRDLHRHSNSNNYSRQLVVNALRPRQNGRHFADDNFKCILFNDNVWIMIKNSLKFVPKGPINNIPALVQIKAWRRPGDKPLSESMLVSLPTHICITRPQCVNSVHLLKMMSYQEIYFVSIQKGEITSNCVHSASALLCLVTAVNVME